VHGCTVVSRVSGLRRIVSKAISQMIVVYGKYCSHLAVVDMVGIVEYVE
jgi:hypothetical protein